MPPAFAGAGSCQCIRPSARAANTPYARAVRAPGQHAAGEEKLAGEGLLQAIIADDAPCDVTDDAAEIGLELAQALVGALELLGMGVGLLLDQRQLADAGIGMAQAHAELFGQPHQPLACAVHELGVGRET